MTLPLLLTYVHLVTSVLLVGYFLFWLIMSIGLERESSPAEAARLRGEIVAARWPPLLLPWRARIPIPGLGWAFLVVLIGTGAWLLAVGPRFRLDGPLGLKLGLVVLLVMGHAAAGRGPGRGLATANLMVALALALVSALLRR